jgi:beta-xylosidase
VRRKLFLIAAALSLVFGSFAPSAPAYAATGPESTYQNPLIWADVPDPSVIRVGDVYYMTSTTMHMNPGVPIMKSYDLANWEIVGYVYDHLEQDDAQSLRNGKSEYGRGSWASSLRYHDGKFYVAFSSITSGKTYIYQTDDIEKGPWQRYELPYFHDMSLLFDEDGRVYMVSGNMNIRLTELTADANAIKPGGIDKVIIENAISVTGRSGTLAEGSHIHKVNGYYYIFLIAWPQGQGRQQIVYRSKNIEGPYEGRVVLNDAGVAQGGIFDTPKGDWYAMLFQDHGAVGRIPYLVPVTWEDGWPVFGENGKLPASIPLPSNDRTLPGIVSSDEFYPNTASMSATGGGAQIFPFPLSEQSEPYAAVETLAAVKASESDSQPDIIINGDFESGVHPWVGREGAMVSVVEDEDGNHILKVTNRDASGDGALQDITDRVEIGEIYEVSARVKYTEGPEVKRFIVSIQFGDDYRDIFNIASVEVQRGTWGTMKGTYTIPADKTMSKVTLFFETPWRSAQNAEEDWMDFYIDDVSMVRIGKEEVPEPEPDPEPANNLIVNWSFEDGSESPWYGREDAVIQVTDKEAANGNYSLYVTSRTRTSSGPEQDMTGKIKAGRMYQISYKVKYTEGPATKNFILTAHYGDTWDLRNMVGGTAQRGVWTTISGTYVVPNDADTSSVRIFIETPWVYPPNQQNDLMNFYIDDVVIVELQVLDKPKIGEFESNGSSLSPVWQWNHNPDHNNWSLLERPGYLRLRTGRVSTDIYDARNTLTQRTFGPESGAVVAMDVSNMKNGDVAGLAAFSSRYGYVAVKRKDNRNYIVMVNNSTGTPQEVQSVEIQQNRVYLKVELDYKNRTDKGYFYYSLDGVTWHAIGNTLQMVYNLEHFMGYRFALFNYATISAGGYVDFDYFRIQHRLTGTSQPKAVLNASLGDAENVLGVPNEELVVPVELDELPSGHYDWIEASFHIPEGLYVKQVQVNSEQVTGDVGYTITDHQLIVRVMGENTGFVHKNSRVFATIRLAVKDYVPADRTLELRTDYIRVSDEDVVFNVHNAVSNIKIRALDTKAVAKVPGYANPLVTHKYGADPYALVYDGRVYLYMTADAYVYDQNGNVVDNNYGQIRSITVISSADLINWTDHGEIPVAGPNGIAKWASNSWAPAIAHKRVNGQDKFYLYFANNASGIGVLEGDSPIGPWRDPRGRALIDRSVPGTSGVVWMFDPAVLVDDDGSAYLYFGGGLPSNTDPDLILSPKTARVIKLGDDMVSTVGEAVMIDAPYMFENSGIHKYGGRYYYSYSTNFAGTRPPGASEHGVIDYMVSDHPLGPFTHIGTILRNPYVFFGVGGNNHHAIFEFNGRWYIAYHAQTVGQALGMVKGYRSTHLNEVTFYENGYIRPIQADREGVESIANLYPYTRIEAETIAWQAGISTQMFPAVERPNLYVKDIDDGDWIAIANVDFGTRGAAALEASVLPKRGGFIEVRLGHPDGELIGKMEVPESEGSDQWMTVKTELNRVTGVHTIFFVFRGEGNDLFQIDYWVFKERDEQPGGGDDEQPGGGDDEQPGGGDDEQPGGGDDEQPGGGDDHQPPAVTPVVPPAHSITIGGKSVSVGRLETSIANGRKTAKILLDKDRLQFELSLAGENPILTIPYLDEADSVIARIEGGNLTDLQGGVIELLTGLGMYSITAEQLVNAARELLGTVSPDELAFEIEFGTISEERMNEVADILENEQMQLILPPLEFKVRVIRNGQTFELTSFGSYVERYIAIPDDADAARVTTAVVIGEDGKVHHVPTQIVEIDGRKYAKVSSVTNSIYALVHYSPFFRDIAGHWAEAYILDLGKRKIVNGIGDDRFAPGAVITRAEFAGIVTRALGLRADASVAASFTDVKPSDWFYEDVRAAYAYGLIEGFTDGTFRPRELITREQAMVIIARAMRLTGLDLKLGEGAAEEALRPFEDAGEVSAWAKDAVALTVRSGIVSGRTPVTLAPQAYLTRSEVAKMVHQLLERSELI